MDPMDFRFETAKELLDHLFDLDYFQREGGEPAPIPYHRVHGKGPLVVMVGENASGKSFARRCVAAICRKAKVEPINTSMEGRAGPDHTGGIRPFIYGSEEWQSTGENSVGTVLSGIKTCQSREKPHIVFWDEPDIGLSDAWAAGVGVAVRKFVGAPPGHTKGVFIVTHSKALVGQLLDCEPHYIYFGDEEPPMSLAHWVEQTTKPKDIEKLHDLSHARFKRIQKILDRIKKNHE